MVEEAKINKILELFGSEVKVIDVGLEHFHKELRRQGVKAIHVAWQPRPKLEKELEDILSKIL